MGRVAWASQTFSGLGQKAHGFKVSPREQWVGGWWWYAFVRVPVCVCVKCWGSPASDKPSLHHLLLGLRSSLL